jgi:hypothetical protein
LADSLNRDAVTTTSFRVPLDSDWAWAEKVDSNAKESALRRKEEIPVFILKKTIK